MSNYLISKYNGSMNSSELIEDTLSSWRNERPDLDFEVMGTFLRLAQLMTRSLRAVEPVFAAHGISLGEFDVLAALRRSGTGASLSPSHLAHVAMVSPGGMTNRLDRLERAGLITRQPDPADRRASLVALTAKGFAVADRAVADLVVAEQTLAAVVSNAERRRFDRTLDKLLTRLDG